MGYALLPASFPLSTKAWDSMYRGIRHIALRTLRRVAPMLSYENRLPAIRTTCISLLALISWFHYSYGHFFTSYSPLTKSPRSFLSMQSGQSRNKSGVGLPSIREYPTVFPHMIQLIVHQSFILLPLCTIHIPSSYPYAFLRFQYRDTVDHQYKVGTFPSSLRL